MMYVYTSECTLSIIWEICAHRVHDVCFALDAFTVLIFSILLLATMLGEITGHLFDI